MTVTIALDAMGGDDAPGMVIDGAIAAAARHPEARFLLVGREDAIKWELKEAGVDSSRFGIVSASQFVEMDEKPSDALRRKKDSSIRVGANLVKSGEADALVSAGNTGALMAIARFVLKTLPGIDRPAIAGLMPGSVRPTLMMDLGANVDCTLDHLVQFSLMGEIYAKEVMGLSKPKIGLLNIGEEEMKGNEAVKKAGDLLKANPCYIGNVEGTDIFMGDVDVVVCDGFVGNIALKTGEGVAQLFTHFLKKAFGKNLLTKLGGLLAYPALKGFKSDMDHRKYNGAMLLGLNGVVVKSHGGADGYAFSNAIRVAVELAENRINDKIKTEVTRLHEGREGAS